MAKIENQNEFIEELGKGVSLICSKDHGFGTDAILLADFSDIKRNEKACDLGTGCGIIPFLWLRNGALGELKGVEIQQLAVDQFNRSLALNNNPENLSVVHHDLREIKKVLPSGHFNLVTMNPPYKPAETGIISASEADKIARHETLCTVYDAANAASSLLNFGGRFCMCHRPERLCDVIDAFRGAGIEPKRIRFVQKTIDTAPWLFLIEGKKGAKPHISVLPPLLIQAPDGGNSEELNRIIGDYAKG